MNGTRNQIAVAVFFWLIGSVCAGPGIGATGQKPANDADSTSAESPSQSAASVLDKALTGSKQGQSAGKSTSQSEPGADTSAKEAQDGESSAGQDMPETEPVNTGEKPDLPKGQGVDVSSFGKIDLHVKDLKLTKVLQLLSIQAKKNIVASKKVSGSVSADLYNVDFYEALDAILHPNGYGYRKEGSFIYVYTAEELKKIQKQNREKVHRIIELSYLNAADASGFVQPLLSPDGSLSVSSQVEEGFKPSVSDGGANSFAHGGKLVVYDYKKNVKEIANVIDQLDTRPKQVLVEATILRAELDEANKFGVDFSLFTNIARNEISSPLSAVDDLISGTAGQGSGATSTVGGVQGSDASVKVGTVGSDGSLFVEALDRVTDTTVLASPKILVLNRQKADLLIGARKGFLTTTQTQTESRQEIQFIETGTQLTLRPFVSKKGYIRLELNPSQSSFSTRTGENNRQIPDETTQELTTNVLVESGQTVVLGGFFKEKTEIGREQVPGLGEIPGLGAAFRGQDDTVERDEIIFLIQPTVVKNKQLAKAGDRMSRDVEDARLGAREGLLPWSQTKLTSSHMTQAMKHQRAGELDEALWDVNLALYLNPNMVDAIQLKEKLTGEKMHFHDHSRLNDVIDTMIEQQLEMDKKQKKKQDGKGAETSGDKKADGDESSAKQQAKSDDAGTDKKTSKETMISVPADSNLAVPSDNQPASGEADRQGPPPGARGGKPGSIEDVSLPGGPPSGEGASGSDTNESEK
jgi:type IV pilus assembly protein PilQ